VVELKTRSNPPRIADGQQVADLVTNPWVGSGAAGQVEQRLAAVDAHDLVEAVGQGQGVAARSAAGVQGASAVIGELGEEPVQDQGRLQAGVTVVIGGQAVKGLRIGHVVGCYRHGAGPHPR
jgi:hypothetical protein